jgi:hypothetical protein
VTAKDVLGVEPQSDVLSGQKNSALEILNQVRMRVGLSPLKLSVELNNAAQAHANYLALNGEKAAYSHSEENANPGFVGVEPLDRVKKFGYSTNSSLHNSNNIGEAITYHSDPAVATKHLFDVLPDRNVLLSDKFEDIGIGMKGISFVIVTGVRAESEFDDNKVVLYPSDNQLDIPIIWINEPSPNILETYRRKIGERFGYPISLLPSKDMKLKFKYGFIKDSKGDDIGFFLVDDTVSKEANGQIHLIPRAPLKNGMTYTVSVNYSLLNDTGEENEKSIEWKFSTASSNTNQVAPIDSNKIDSPKDDGVAIINPFNDINSHWGKDSILWAVKRGIVNGYQDGSFKPDKKVTEAEFISMIVRIFKPSIKPGETEWELPYYNYVSDFNLIDLVPYLNKRHYYIDRRQVAQIISATQGVHYMNNDAITYMLANGLANGNDDDLTISSFGGENLLTRAEAIQFIKNLTEKGKGNGRIFARPKKTSDKNLLPEIPIGNSKAELYDLPYKPPFGWIPPKIESLVTDDVNANYEILKEELGMTGGGSFNPYGYNAWDTLTSIIIFIPDDPFRVQLVFSSWGSGEDGSVRNKTPYIARELYKFYLPEGYEELFKIVDDWYNQKGNPESLDKTFMINGVAVKIWAGQTFQGTYAVKVSIGKN